MSTDVPVRAGTPLNQSVERAVRLLGFFSPEEPELTLADLTARLGTSKATTHRYTMALRHAGLLRYDPGNGLYTLGARVVELAASALAGLRIIKVAGPHMERLVQRVNETAVLSIWDGESPIVVRVEDNIDRIVRIVVRTGSRLPIDSAQGKINVAFNPEIRDHGLEEAELERVRAARIAVNSQVVEGIRAIATPVFQDRTLAGAMAIVGTTAGVPEEDDSLLAHRLIEAAEALSAELGFLRNERSV
ncbi:MAG: IclR family transcriptional regulator [Actinomycetota bacterium]